MNPIAQFFFDTVNGFFLGIPALLATAVYLRMTPENLTTGNPFVQLAWGTMTTVALSFLSLYVTVKVIQIMYGYSTGTIQMPVSQLLPKVLRTVILIALSSFLGTFLVQVNNALCSLVAADIKTFMLQEIQQLNALGGQQFAVFLLLSFLLGFYIIRIVFQVVKRIIFFNVLYVLSGPAFVLGLDRQTEAWFAFWLRTYLVTSFSQFLQFLTFALGFQFLAASQQQGVTALVFGIVVLALTTEIPGLLSRFGTTAGAASGGGMGSVIGTGLMAARMLAL